VLYTLYRTKASIRVVTRHSRGIRGVSTGSLLAFDKHMNLVMKDVEEKYTVLVPFVNDKSRSVRRLEHRQRRLKLVFIYGSSIVMISKALDSHENSSKGLS
jgi:small nuclear ribonucleoprotein (snRNP)-like protein